jgi:hypothetical protein
MNPGRLLILLCSLFFLLAAVGAFVEYYEEEKLPNLTGGIYVCL